MKRAADREREQAEAEAAATREAEAAEQRRRAKKAYLENYPVDERVRMGFMKTALGTLLGQMKARKWEGWPYTDGNPFLLVCARPYQTECLKFVLML